MARLSPGVSLEIKVDALCLRFSRAQEFRGLGTSVFRALASGFQQWLKQLFWIQLKRVCREV